jgi:predicted Zn finger-like uncharacterized protein
MRLVCLECSAAYEAPDSLFGQQPREVRCNRCGYQWTVVGTRPEEQPAPAGLTVGAPGAPMLVPSQAAEPPRPRPAMAPPARPEPLAAAPPPPPVPPLQRPSRLADVSASTAMPSDNLTDGEVPRPVLVVEPTAASTRTLLSSAPADKAYIAPPDPEERRLSHDLDFGETARPRPTSTGGGGTRRAVVILILLIILAGMAAVIFEAQVIAAVPALKSVYAQLGL